MRTYETGVEPPRYGSPTGLVGRIRKTPGGGKPPVILMSSIDPALHPHGSWHRVLRKPFSLDGLFETIEERVGT